MKESKNQPISSGDQKMKEYHKKDDRLLSFAEAIKRATKSIQNFTDAVNRPPK